MIRNTGRQKPKAETLKAEMGPAEAGPKTGFPGCRASWIADLTQSRKGAKAQRVFTFFPFFASLRLCVFALNSSWGIEAAFQPFSLSAFQLLARTLRPKLSFVKVN